MIKHWKNRLFARLCSGAMASFRKRRLEFSPEDIEALHVSFSQYGEDLLIADHLLHRKGASRGIYIDAGCFDPFRLSNTRLLSLLGWKGINIDLAQDVVKKFQLYRPEDYNVCAALSNQEKMETTFVGKPGLASYRLAKADEAKEGETIKTTTLTKVLADSPFHSQSVDLLDVDCEMHDLEVLSGFPFALVRPMIICVEAHSRDEFNNMADFLGQKDYIKLGTRGPSHIFRDSHSIPKDTPSYSLLTEL